MSTVVRKEDAHKLIDQLPPNATWDDLMHEIYMHEAIEKSIEDSRLGRTKDVSEIRKKYSLPEWKLIGQKQLRHIWISYIAQDSKTYALRTIDRITTKSKQIATFPLSGRRVPEYDLDQIREVFSDSYRVIYYIKPDQIDIIAVIHGTRNVLNDGRE